MENKIINSGKVSKALLVTNIFFACLYLAWWLDIKDHIGQPILYYLLLFSEIYHVLLAIGFWFTILPRDRKANLTSYIWNPSIDVFIPVAGEPIEIIEKTVRAAKDIVYPNKTIYILNDGYVTKKDNWQGVEQLAKSLTVRCITRKIPGGSKAGNINNALKQTKGELIAIFDSDMVAYPEFLKTTVPYFEDRTVGFVQTPQYYKNHEKNDITSGAWEQQDLFFGPIMIGKDTLNSAFICGTNVVIRRDTLEEVGGMVEDNIAEDFLTSLLIHQKGWKSYYIDQVLSEGLAPEDLLSYFRQQVRWARGSLEVLFGQNPVFRSGLTINQKIQYLLSALYYFNGVIVFIDMLMPLFFLYFGLQPVSITTTSTSIALLFIPFISLTLYTLYLASGEGITFRAISFVQGSFALQIQALFSVILRKKTKFNVTAKQARVGNYLFLVYPHLAYVLIGLFAVWYRLGKVGFNASVVTNITWFAFNTIMFMPFIWAAFPWKKYFSSK